MQNRQTVENINETIKLKNKERINVCMCECTHGRGSVFACVCECLGLCSCASLCVEAQKQNIGATFWNNRVRTKKIGPLL